MNDTKRRDPPGAARGGRTVLATLVAGALTGTPADVPAGTGPVEPARGRPRPHAGPRRRVLFRSPLFLHW